MAYTSSLKIANQLLKVGKLDDARREYQKLIKLRPNFSWNYYYLGQVFVQEDKWSDAIAQYRQAIKFNPNSAHLYNSLAEALIKQGELDEAINSSQKAISLQPDWAIYHQTLALAYEAKSNFGQAFKTWKKVLSLNLNHLRATQKISWLQTDIAKNCAESGNKLNKEGKIREAVEFYQQALILNPQQPMSIYQTCGNNLITLGRLKEAESVFEKSIKVYPELPSGYERYAVVTHYLADWELALERWENAITKFPEHIVFQVNKGNVLINLSRFDEAEAIFQQLKEKYPNQPSGYERYAVVTHYLADWELALERWENAITKFPEHFNFYLHKGDVLANLFRYEEAETWWEKVIAQYPDYNQGLSKSAALARQLGNREFAWQRFEQTIKKFPWYIPAYCEAARELIAMGRFAEAEEKFGEALQRNPNHLTVLLQAGILASQQGNRKLALERFERAIEFYHPQKATDAYILAATELKYLGRKSEAIAKYEQILSFHQQRGLYPEVKLLGTGLTSIQELGLLLDRPVTKQPDSVENVVSLAKLTDKILFSLYRKSYPAPVAKDAPSLLSKLRILRELFWQFLATPDGCQEWDLGVTDFGYDLYLLVVAKLLNDRFLRLFSLYFHTLVQQWDEYLLVLKHFNMAIQLLEKESQRLNSSMWGRVKLVRTEIPLPLIDKLCFDSLSSSARYVMGADERMPQSQIEATVKYLPGLMDEEKEYFAASVRQLTSLLKLRSKQTIEIFKDFICEPPYGVSEGYLFNRYDPKISEKFVREFIDKNTTSSIEHIAPGHHYGAMADIRANLDEIAIRKTALDSYYEDDVVFGLPVYVHIWGAYQNYGHLLFDQIPSLILYQKLNLSCPIFVPHITDGYWEIFNALNIPKEKILVKQEQKFKHFMIGQYRWDVEMVNFYRNLRESIVARLLGTPSLHRNRYVYISRRYSEGRKMANEVEVEELMASLGFSIVYAERLNFEEKAMLMHHASVVITTLGSGLMNTIMCHQGTSIVVIYPPGFNIYHYAYNFCVLGGFKLYPLLGKKTAHKSIIKIPKFNRLKNGWIIDIHKLKKVVRALLENER